MQVQKHPTMMYSIPYSLASAHFGTVGWTERWVKVPKCALALWCLASKSLHGGPKWSSVNEISLNSRSFVQCQIGSSIITSKSSSKNLSNENKHTICSLVTQPMLQLRPNWTELRSMDYYHQIFCRFRKCKRKVPPPSPLSTQKSPFTPPPPPRIKKIILWGGGGGGKGTF